MRRMILCVLLLSLLLGLCGCAAVDGSSAALPDLRLLEPLPAMEPPPAEETAEESPDPMRVDLWLDASQVMGGINPNEDSMYPHSSRKYREGGFHYRFENQAGMYETVLRSMLAGVEGSRIRLLRCGNERLPYEFLLAQGLVTEQTEADQIRSLRRDMLTYAIDPMPSIFTAFSGEKMTDSFYSPGTPQLNQVESLIALENPSMKEMMAGALEKQINTIQMNPQTSLMASGDEDCTLLYALDNLDLSRLSVITFDPAGLRRLSEVDAAGSVHALIEEKLQERGVFDAGLSVGLYAFTLDYMGQLSSFGAADFTEPLLWGRLDYDNKTGESRSALVMPRTLLALVIGKAVQVETFTAAFEQQLAASDTLKVPRGPQNGQLTYTLNGQTVVQEPFGFDYEYTVISRAQFEQITQYTEGTKLMAEDTAVSENSGLTTVTLAPVNGLQPDRKLTLSLPLETLADGMALDASELANVSLTVQDAILLTDTIENGPDAAVPQSAQAIALRDKLFIFTRESCESPVSCTGLSASGQALTVSLHVDGSALKPGYYRILFSADLPGGNMQWHTPEWVQSLNTTITNEQISEWEAFTKLLSKYERKRDYITRPYQHAWGDAENDAYYQQPVPDFPPVMLAPGLSELVSQLQSAAQPGSTPYIRYVFDLFVDNQP